LKLSDIEVKLIDSMGSDLSVVNAARVSFAKESEFIELNILGTDFSHKVLREEDKRLINYLAKHKHYSPFNHTFLSFRIKAPIFVARQLVKHEYMPWNEESRRYVDNEPEFYPLQFRWKAEKVKQGSGAEVDEMTQSAAEVIFWNAVQGSLDAYNKLLEIGICAEQARAVLPVDQVTEWYWSGTLKAFHKMLGLRLDPHAQKEAQIVAQKIAPAIEELFPVSFPALMNNN
jgi:thymidylate synthase (FAD)